jgi:hypothetical protein
MLLKCAQMAWRLIFFRMGGGASGDQTGGLEGEGRTEDGEERYCGTEDECEICSTAQARVEFVNSERMTRLLRERQAMHVKCPNPCFPS